MALMTTKMVIPTILMAGKNSEGGGFSCKGPSLRLNDKIWKYINFFLRLDRYFNLMIQEVEITHLIETTIKEDIIELERLIKRINNLSLSNSLNGLIIVCVEMAEYLLKKRQNLCDTVIKDSVSIFQNTIIVRG